MNFASFKSALGKAYETAASTAATAAKDLQAQVPSCSRLEKAKFRSPCLHLSVPQDCLVQCLQQSPYQDKLLLLASI